MKTFGLVVPKGQGGVFEMNVSDLLAGGNAIDCIIMPLLNAWRAVRARTAELDRQLILGSPEHRLPSVDDHARDRHRDGSVLRRRHRDARQLRALARRRYLGRLDTTTIPIGRGRL